MKLFFTKNLLSRFTLIERGFGSITPPIIYKFSPSFDLPFHSFLSILRLEFRKDNSLGLHHHITLNSPKPNLSTYIEFLKETI